MKLPALYDCILFHVPHRRAPLMVWADPGETKMDALNKVLAEEGCTYAQITILRGAEKIHAYRQFEIAAANGWLTTH